MACVMHVCPLSSGVRLAPQSMHDHLGGCGGTHGSCSKSCGNFVRVFGIMIGFLPLVLSVSNRIEATNGLVSRGGARWASGLYARNMRRICV